MIAALSGRAGTAVRLLTLIAMLGLTGNLPAAAQSASPAAGSVAGTWRGPVITDGPSGVMTVVVVQEAGAWKTTTDYEGDGIPPGGTVREFKVEGNLVTWAQTVGEFEVVYRAKVEGDVMRGDLEAYQAGTMVAGGMFELKKQP
jgi:hypothetical protein